METKSFAPGALVTTMEGDTKLYGKVLYTKGRYYKDGTDLVVADWYRTPARKGIVWQVGYPVSAVSEER